ncbi:MAG: EamA family transporter [Planctomycetota bacterium]
MPQLNLILPNRFSLLLTSPGLGTGIACGIASAIFYTLSNIALRQATSVDPFFVAAIKAAPTVLCLAPVFLVQRWKYRDAKSASITHSWSAAIRFAGVSLVGQVVGNGAFQIALGSIGLAASVPIAMGTLLIGGAILGRLFLGEPVNATKIVSIAMLVIAVVVLTQSQANNADSIAQDPKQGVDSQWSVLNAPPWVGAACAIACGAAYAFFSSQMRKFMQQGMPAFGAMWISGVVGTVALWAITISRDGFEPMQTADASQWRAMIAAGIFNFVAFLAISTALRVLPVVAVHLLNASQVAMAATAGVVMFHEAVTGRLIVGLALTMAGLLVLTAPIVIQKWDRR